jgi:hypothetical protein
MNPQISQSGVNRLCLKNFAASNEVMGTEIIAEIAINPISPNLFFIKTILLLPFVKTGFFFFDFK